VPFSNWQPAVFIWQVLAAFLPLQLSLQGENIIGVWGMVSTCCAAY